MKMSKIFATKSKRFRPDLAQVTCLRKTYSNCMDPIIRPVVTCTCSRTRRLPERGFKMACSVDAAVRSRFFSQCLNTF